MKRLLLLALLLVLPLSAWAQSPAGSIQVDHPWARVSAGKTGAVYLTVKNTGTADDRLVDVMTPAAGKAQLHIESNDNGVMKMRPLSAIDVKANGQAVLKPGGMHVMLIGLKQPLKAGESFPLTLVFEKAGKIDVTVMVEKGGPMGGMKM